MLSPEESDRHSERTGGRGPVFSTEDWTGSVMESHRHSHQNASLKNVLIKPPVMFGNVLKRGMQSTRTLLLTTIFLLVIVIILQLRNILQSEPPKSVCRPKIICIEYGASSNSSSLQVVKQIQPTKFQSSRDANADDLKKCKERIRKTENDALSKYEISGKEACVSTSAMDAEKGHTEFWTDDTQYIRRTHHSYLTSASIILDIGGNVGDDAVVLLNQYFPQKYVMLEPMTLLYRSLLKRFADKDNVVIYNFGLSTKNSKFLVNIEGTEGDATSVFKESDAIGSCPLFVMNATNFFIELGIGCFEVDLITINCEGCEFAVLEAILSTNVINFLRNIQFATHMKLDHLKNPVERYCAIQQKLARTHKLTYQYKFTWESWRRKDIID
ncbi:hypothetical protein FSP39_017916 [Pinctada imbricata]|uniref:Methyltransferase FkbM domain-containing protein n=1 Tax=Pinctada imbricata TaxID=66713 RepID=A0AA89BRG0_PINIB|nr:hypothetical protein FSP39_017916 [Pinctada imbricata]